MKKGTMQMKRILSIALAAILILSMSIPAAAETGYTTETGSAKIRYKGGVLYYADPGANGTLYVTITTDNMVQLKVYDRNSNKEFFPFDYQGKVNALSYPQEYFIPATGKTVTASFEYSVREGERYEIFIIGCALDNKASNITITYSYPSAKAESTKSTDNTQTTSPIMTIDLKKGSSLQLGAEFPSDAKIAWETSKKSVATVSSSGKVTAVAAGSATIKATSGNKSVKIKIKVS